ncbi:hypothetical protein T492DRAFT_855431, partial [Pavlovales sp. CCMP2436]
MRLAQGLPVAAAFAAAEMLTMRLSWVDPPVPDAGVRVPTRLAVFQNGFASLTPWNASPTLGEINSSFADSHRRVDE